MVEFIDSVSEESLTKYFTELEQLPILSSEEERLIVARCASGDSNARERLICANLRLVVFAAKKYRKYVSRPAFVDLIQSGNLGLIYAVDHVNPSFQNRFSTYAMTHIRKCILLTLGEERKLVHIPSKIAALSRQMEHARRKLFSQNFCEPPLGEIATEIGATLEQCTIAATFCGSEVSLSRHSCKSGNNFWDFPEEEILDMTYSEDAARIECALMGPQLNLALKKLTPCERNVIVKRFGLAFDSEMTLAEIANCTGITREAVRRTEVRALAKLKKFLVHDKK